MTGAEQSLLAFIDAPVVVGDPDGHAVYVNSAFESRFEREAEGCLGQPLALLFEGGGREAVLRAVASACEHGESVRFRLREGEVGFSAVASPIMAEDASVGVVILLKEEVEGVERLLALHRQIQEPMDELTVALDNLLEQTGGRRDAGHREFVEDGLRALTRLRKWSEEVGAVLAGAPGPKVEARFDLAELVRRVASRVSRDAERRSVRVDLLAAATLPPVRLDGDRLETTLLSLIQDCLRSNPRPARISLGARPLDSRSSDLLVSITEHGTEEAPLGPATVSPLHKESIASLSGEVHTVVDPKLGRTLLIRLPGLPSET